MLNILPEEIVAILGNDSPPVPPLQDSGKPRVILVAGVNGVGKTTSIAKLAAHLKGQGNSVVLAAADTFRAAAIEQLTVWAERIDVPIVKTQYQGDPSAVCFDGYWLIFADSDGAVKGVEMGAWGKEHKGISINSQEPVEQLLLVKGRGRNGGTTPPRR